MTKETAECQHDYTLSYSTFGADQGAFCRKCWRQAPTEEYKRLKIVELEKDIERVKKL